MTFRPGSDNPRSGARLPRPRGPFCAICQDVERSGNRIVVGMWAHLRFHMDLPLCESCIRDHAPRLDPDPLTIEDAA